KWPNASVAPCLAALTQPNSSMVPSGNHTCQQMPVPKATSCTTVWLSGAVCQMDGSALSAGTGVGFSVVAVLSGGINCPLRPLESLMFHMLSHVGAANPSVTFCSLQLIDPRPTLQPSPPQGAPACTLCVSWPEPLEYARLTGGVRPPGPGGTLRG